MSANLWYSEGTLERSGVSASFVELAWMSEEWRQSSKLWELGSFDTCKNAATPMIAMLGCSELDTEVSDTGMETAESDDCRGVSKKDRDVVATTRHKSPMITQAINLLGRYQVGSSQENSTRSLFLIRVLYTKYIWSMLQPHVHLISYSRSPCVLQVSWCHLPDPSIKF